LLPTVSRTGQTTIRHCSATRAAEIEVGFLAVVSYRWTST